MDVFGVGPAELLVILVITLIVVGPRRLPEMAANLARFVRTLRQYSAQVTREFSDTMRDLEQEYDDMRGEWKEIGQGLDETAREVGSELEAAERDASDGAAEQAPRERPTPG